MKYHSVVRMVDNGRLGNGSYALSMEVDHRFLSEVTKSCSVVALAWTRIKSEIWRMQTDNV